MANDVGEIQMTDSRLVPERTSIGPRDSEEHSPRKRKRRTKKRYERLSDTVNDEAEQAIAPDSYSGLSSTQDLLGEPDFPSSQWPSFEMLELISSVMEPIHSSPPTVSSCDQQTPPWPDVRSVITSENTDATPSQQVMGATELSISILEHTQKWNLTSYPIELLSDTFESFGKCILNLKYRLDCVDTFANTMMEMLEARPNDQNAKTDQEFLEVIRSLTKDIKRSTSNDARPNGKL